MAGIIDCAPLHMSLEEVTVNAGHEILMEVDDNSVPIVDDPQGTRLGPYS
jgi:hypothetical protein